MLVTDILELWHLTESECFASSLHCLVMPSDIKRKCCFSFLILSVMTNYILIPLFCWKLLKINVVMGRGYEFTAYQGFRAS